MYIIERHIMPILRWIADEYRWQRYCKLKAKHPGPLKWGDCQVFGAYNAERGGFDWESPLPENDNGGDRPCT